MRRIPGHSGYFATDEGTIVSTRRGRPRILKGYVNDDGYVTVTVTADDGLKRKTLVHRLIAFAYLGDAPFVDAVVRHMNGRPIDNRPDNLAWGTVRDNYLDAVRHGTRAHGEAVGGRLTPTDTILRVREALGLGMTGKCIAQLLGLSEAQVSRIKTGRRWANMH